MRDYAKEFENRVAFIRGLLKSSGTKGVIYGNSGGKDSALVGILCKMACDNTEGIILPCSSKRNFTIDKDDGMEVAEKFGIKTRILGIHNDPQRNVIEVDLAVKIGKYYNANTIISGLESTKTVQHVALVDE